MTCMKTISAGTNTVYSETKSQARRRDAAWIIGRLRSSSITAEMTYDLLGYLVLVIAASAAAEAAAGDTK